LFVIQEEENIEGENLLYFFKGQIYWLIGVKDCMFERPWRSSFRTMLSQWKVLMFYSLGITDLDILG